MEKTGRSELLKWLLPGLGAWVIYILLFYRGISASVGQLERSKAAALLETPALDLLEKTVARRDVLIVEKKLLQDERARLPEPAASANLPASSTAARQQASERLTLLLAEHQLRLVEERLDPAAVGQKLPAAVQPHGPAGIPAASRLRNLHFQGRYLDVKSALDKLAAPDSGIVPLRLQMKKDAGKRGALDWTLTVWM